MPEIVVWPESTLGIALLILSNMAAIYSYLVFTTGVSGKPDLVVQPETLDDAFLVKSKIAALSARLKK